MSCHIYIVSLLVAYHTQNHRNTWYHRKSCGTTDLCGNVNGGLWYPCNTVVSSVVHIVTIHRTIPQPTIHINTQVVHYIITSYFHLCTRGRPITYPCVHVGNIAYTSCTGNTTGLYGTTANRSHYHTSLWQWYITKCAAVLSHNCELHRQHTTGYPSQPFTLPHAVLQCTCAAVVLDSPVVFCEVTMCTTGITTGLRGYHSPLAHAWLWY